MDSSLVSANGKERCRIKMMETGEVMMDNAASENPTLVDVPIYYDFRLAIEVIDSGISFDRTYREVFLGCQDASWFQGGQS